MKVFMFFLILILILTNILFVYFNKAVTTIHNDCYIYKKVLVTGGAGFIGCNFLSYIVPKYPQVHFTCIDKLNYASNSHIIKQLELLPNFCFIQLDLSESLEKLLDITRDTTDIINFAAESCVDRSFLEPLYFTKTIFLLLKIY